MTNCMCVKISIFSMLHCVAAERMRERGRERSLLMVLKGFYTQFMASYKCFFHAGIYAIS
jgi:hypothetical protein